MTSRSVDAGTVEPAATRTCPQCGASVPVHPGFVTWCECGWNLVAPAPPSAGGRFGRLYADLGRRLGNRLVVELAAADSLEPRWTASRVAAYAVAATVYAGVGLLVGAALLALVVGFPDPFAIGIGVFLLAFAGLLRPRFGKPPNDGILDRSEAPTLYGLADEVADALGTAPVDAIVVDHEFNASWAVLGLRRMRVMTLGLPLLATLDPQERVALIAHELAHARNGDARRSFVVGGALGALEEVYAVLAPDWDTGAPDELGFFEKLTGVAMWVLSRPVLGLLYLQLLLLLRDSQRAEYLADALAARVAGSKNEVSATEKLFLEPTLRAAVQHVSRDGGNVFRELETRTARVPERERERRRRVARLEEARLDATHPPTASRLELVESRPQTEPTVVLERERSARIDAELAGRREDVERLLVEEYRDSLSNPWA